MIEEVKDGLWVGLLATIGASLIVAVSVVALTLILAKIHPDCAPHITHGGSVHCVRL